MLHFNALAFIMNTSSWHHTSCISKSPTWVPIFTFEFPTQKCTQRQTHRQMFFIWPIYMSLNNWVCASIDIKNITQIRVWIVNFRRRRSDLISLVGKCNIFWLNIELNEFENNNSWYMLQNHVNCECIFCSSGPRFNHGRWGSLRRNASAGTPTGSAAKNNYPWWDSRKPPTHICSRFVVSWVQS